MKKVKDLAYLSAIVIVVLASFSCKAQGAKYYLDSQKGSDDNPGTKQRPWKTISKLNNFVFKPGDTIYFTRGSSFHGGFIVSSSGTAVAPIVFTSCGQGRLPKFTNSDVRHLNGNVVLIKGSHIVIDGLYFHNGPVAPPGTRIVREMGAVFIAGGADHNTIKNCEVYDYPLGFQIYGEHCLITRNYIHDCTGYLQYPSWGPIGIMVATSNNEISYNRITNYIVTGGTYGADGGAIEIDNSEIPKENIKVHHNYTVGNEGFLEIIPGDIKKVHIHHNISDDYQEFIFFWGGRDCVVENNIALCLRPNNSNAHVVFSFTQDEVSNITVRNNIFVLANGLQVFGGNLPHGPQDYNQPRDHNIYFCIDGSQQDPCGKPLGKGDIIADPLFVDFKGRNLHLRPGSPAIDAGADVGQSLDFDNNVIPSGKAPDIGAYEYGYGKNGASLSDF